MAGGPAGLALLVGLVAGLVVGKLMSNVRVSDVARGGGWPVAGNCQGRHRPSQDERSYRSENHSLSLNLEAAPVFSSLPPGDIVAPSDIQ